MSVLQADVLVAGGGLSGLAIADALARAGVDYRLVEARRRLGGRVLTGSTTGGRFDLGPAWIWPHNHRTLALAGRLGLSIEPQYANGLLVFQDANGHVRRDLDFSTMGGALRISGGLSGLTGGLAEALDARRVLTGKRVHAVTLGPRGVSIETEDGVRLTSNRLVLAIPPRLLTDRIRFSPALPPEVATAFSATPTWMAGHAKFVAAYSQSFWREAGLSGDTISHRGPLMEIHDATDGVSGTPGLFGFAMPGAARQPGFRAAALAQLADLFGPEAGRPDSVLVQDWSAEPDTAVAADAVPPEGHPAYGFPPGVLQTLETWSDGRILFAGTETAKGEGGFLEGALESAEYVNSALAAPEHGLPAAMP